MSNIYVTSDLHLNHDKEFLYKPRGFDSIEDMNMAIVNNWNSVVSENDIVYVLGDLMLGGNEGTKKGIELLKLLNGEMRVILGNHDTDNRTEAYKTVDKITSIKFADRIKYNGYSFFLTHFPCITSNLEKETLKQCTINLFGHTHQTTNFYMEYPFMYHVGMDSHNCTPVSMDQIITDLIEQVNNCKNNL